MITDAQFAAWLRADGVAREILVEVGCYSGGAEITRYLSRFGYHTGAGDTPASQSYRAVLRGGMSWERKLAVTSTEPAVSVTRGDIVVQNFDGALDSWLTDVWTRRPIRVYVGDPGWPRADFRQVFTGRVASIKPNGLDSFSLVIYDELQRLNYPITEQLLGGTTENKNSVLPITLGEVFNVTPLLVNPGTLTYQYNNGPCEGLIEVRDIGAPITSFTDNPATGMFTLTASPVGAIQVDAQGVKAGKSTAGSYLSTPAELVEELVTNYGSPTHRLNISEVDVANFNSFNTAHPATIGMYVSDKVNVLDACNQIMRSVSGSMIFGRAGLLQLYAPLSDSEAAALIAAGGLTEFTVGGIVAGSFSVAEIVPDIPSVKLGWGRNWTPTASGLAGGLPQTTLTTLALDMADKLVADNARVALHNYTATPVREETLLVNEADAQAEAQRRVDLRAQRRIVAFTVDARGYQVDLGQVVLVTHPRLDAGVRRAGVVVMAHDDLAADSVSLEVLIFEGVTA